MTGTGCPERDTTRRIVDAYCRRVADPVAAEPERVLAKAEDGWRGWCRTVDGIQDAAPRPAAVNLSAWLG